MHQEIPESNARNEMTYGQFLRMLCRRIGNQAY